MINNNSILQIIFLLWNLFGYHNFYSQSKEIDSLINLLQTQASAKEQAGIKINLADYFLEINPNKAESYLSEIDLKKIKEPKIIAKYYITKSILEKIKGNTKKSIELIQKARQELKLSNQATDLLHCKINYCYASALNDDRNFKKAVTYYLKALDQAKKIKNEQMESSIYSGLGNVYLHIKNYKKAKQYFLKSIEIKLKNKQIDKHLANYYSNLSSCFDEEKKYKKSLFYLNKAIQINTASNRIISLINNFNNKAYTLYLLKEYNQAEIYVKKAIHLADSLNIENQKAYPLSSYSEILFAQNKDKTAKKMAEESTKTAKKNKDFFLLSYNYNLLYTNMLKKKKYVQAIKYLNLKNSAEDSIFNIRKAKQINQLQIQYQTEKKNNKILLLENKNRLKDIKLNKIHQKNKTILITTVLTIIILLLLLIYNKNRIKTNQITSNNLKQKYEKELLTLELKALRTQMNPHFLFNCLNSINSYIIQNKSNLASEYLTKFSKLIRLVLNNSKQAVITLEKELETLKLYIEMEKIRFDNDFEYSISIEDNIDSEFIELPPLIIQPFVENSIWHGLLNKKDLVKKISIKIKLKEQYLICSITDNGIGREASKLIQKKKVKKHKSFGIEITKKRLHLFNKNSKNQSSIITTDLKDLYNNAIGTKVDIKIYIA